jgi:hypothetical protein
MAIEHKNNFWHAACYGMVVHWFFMFWALLLQIFTTTDNHIAICSSNQPIGNMHQADCQSGNMHWQTSPMAHPAYCILHTPRRMFDAIPL